MQRPCVYAEGTGLDWVPLAWKVSRWVFPGWVQQQAGADQCPCVSGVTWASTCPTWAGPIPRCSRTGSPSVLLSPGWDPALGGGWPRATRTCHHCCHGYNSNISNVTVNFMALFFIGGFGQNAVVVQLINTNCWFWRVCSKRSGGYVMYLWN